MGLRTTNWEQIRRYKKDSAKGDLYMAEHPLSHDDAVAQSQRLRRQKEEWLSNT